MAEIQTITVQALLHLKDGNKVGVTFINGHEERYKLENPMTVAETEEFFETNVVQK